jgi:hypothetical protein
MSWIKCIYSLSINRGILYSKGIPQQAKVVLGVPGRLRPWIITTFGTTRVVGRQPYALATFTSGEILGTHFQRLSRPQGTCFCWKEPQKKSPVTIQGIDPRTVRLVAHCLKHYATPGPFPVQYLLKFQWSHQYNNDGCWVSTVTSPH